MSTLYKREDSPYWWWSSKYRGKRLRMSTGLRKRKESSEIQTRWDMMLLTGNTSFLKEKQELADDPSVFMDEYLKVRRRVSSNTANTASSVLKRFKCFLKGLALNLRRWKDIHTSFLVANGSV